MFRISSTTELLIMSFCGLATTMYEGSVQNMNENVKKVWAANFPPDSTIGIESLVKSVMTAITLARGLTVHIHIAAYLLMLYPLLFERGGSLLLLWMLVAGLRTVVVNLAAFLTGAVVCSSYSDLKQVCFEFTAIKSVEICCSVFMWLSVNDFHIKLRNQRRNASVSRTNTKTTQISDSDASLASSSDFASTSFVDFEEEDDSSEDSILVKSAVEWLTKMAFGMKCETRRADQDTARAEKFLNMTSEELQELQTRIKEQLGKRGQKPKKENEEHTVNVGHSSATSFLHGAPSVGKAVNGEEGTAESGNPTQSELPAQSVSSQTDEPSRKLRGKLNKGEAGSNVGFSS